jgi:hypothetical protein
MTPRKVFLFSGHMIDAPGREVPRFPASAEWAAKAAIARKLDELSASAADLAVAAGARGGDLLFAESALERAVPLEMYLPFDAETFINTSVAGAGADWVERFRSAAARSTLHLMPPERGPAPHGVNPYEHNNLWMLEAAGRFGPERVEFLCLWNGRKGDGPGGAAHLWKAVEDHGGRAHWLDINRLW